jgi:hypothetical protein
LKINKKSKSIKAKFEIFKNESPISLGLFYMYHSRLGTSELQVFQESHLFNFIYLIWALSSAVINLVVKVYSVWINKKLAMALPVLHNQEEPHLNKDKFILSLTSVLVIPLIFLTGFLSSLSSREVRLKILFPLQITMMGVFLPVLLIAVNPKMKC